MSSTDKPTTKRRDFQEAFETARRYSAGWAAGGAAIGFLLSFAGGEMLPLDRLLMATALGGGIGLAALWCFILVVAGGMTLVMTLYWAFNFVFQLRVILALLFAAGIYYAIKIGFFTH